MHIYSPILNALCRKELYTTDEIMILKPLDASYGLEEWILDNLKFVETKTGLKLDKGSVNVVHDGFVVKTTTLEQTFFVRCDNRRSSEHDLGCILIECALQEADGVIWLANQPDEELTETFNWFEKVARKDFEIYLIPVKVNFTEPEKD